MKREACNRGIIIMTACEAACTRSSFDGDVCGIFLERKCRDWLLGTNKMDFPFNDLLNVGHISCHFDKPDRIAVAFSFTSFHLLGMCTFTNILNVQFDSPVSRKILGSSAYLTVSIKMQVELNFSSTDC
ncbi:hypothetical protein NPIL_227771 [Nephila pilipes]|uniref:Uncharacterized protein n=1 Tax=Nephila pilipes TaxID=299642 RepID=A0A8X6M6E8_NEPPI|nr:hypothetical protein NPIL_227771 [Nephila pilipes]